MKDLVLVGGGHSHLAVLKRFGMKPVAGLRVTLITRDVHTPYSGMLPGHIAGHYNFDESHIDLRPLALFAGARLYHAEVEGIDLANKTIACRGRPPVSYDVLSINTGSRPSVVNIPGADRHVLPVKPIDAFLRGWEEIVDRVRAGDGAYRVVVVGGGAGGVELALATQHRLRQELRRADKPVDRLTYHLVTDTDQVLPTHNARARAKFMCVLRERKISVHAASAVQRVERGRVHCAGGRALETDSVLWVTHAAAPAWIRESGLATDEDGFIRVNDALQSVSHPEVFAAGDVAAVVDRPRAKSGVFAVRQGPPLANNLRRAVLGKKPRAFTPQTHFLGLISTGDQYAVASRANWSIEGRWVWRVKNWIDRRFMRKYNEPPEMEHAQRIELARGIADGDAIKEISAVAMRCGGCGAKVGSTVLARVVNRLMPFERDDVLIGLHEPDDAAVIEVPAGKVLVQSVDYFRAFLDDAYVFGKIAANHSLSDIYAMGADPQSAMAIATVPYGREQVVEEQLYQIMAGAVEVLNASRTALVGGHSSEGAELAFGLSVTGTVDRAALLRKGGMKTGDVLILTKPLGTGTLFAADMRLKAKGRWIDGAIESMLASNQAAAACLHKYGATACTDVTGFGLLGHLVEMIRPSDGDVELDLDALPVLDGARETIQAGVFSSLQPQNVRLRRAIRNLNGAVEHEHYPLLFDPQTAGGLLASVPTQAAERCLAELHGLGYAQAARIGRVVARENVLEPVRLISTTLPN
jgi:selenide,water dikinase